MLVVRGMEDSDWPQVSALIADQWEMNHPVLDFEFFFWQHRGFGELAGVGSTALAFESNRLVGMRGVIPGVYQVPMLDGSYDFVPGGSFAMWIVEKDSRGIGIGGRLLEHCEQHLPVMVALGSNELTSVPIYLKNGFARQDAVHHWFRVLDEKGVALLYGQESGKELVRPLIEDEHLGIREIFEPQIAAGIWARFSEKHQVFGLHRNVDFWKWRYFDHPSFHYRILVDETLASLAVTRLENVMVRGEEITVLRIIELFSSLSDENNPSGKPGIAKFIQMILAEASKYGISAADYRCSNTIMGPSLAFADFAFRSMEAVPAARSGFAGQLNPLILGPRPINLHWKIRHQSAESFPETYFVKSDNDMDRPNLRGQKSPNLG